MDPAYPCEGLVAVVGDGGLACLAGFCAIPWPLRVAEGGFLDDLFANPYRRGDGTGKGLLRCVDEIVAKRGWRVFRWITRDNNQQARDLYDRVSHRSDRATYELTAATTGREVK